MSKYLTNSPIKKTLKERFRFGSNFTAEKNTGKSVNQCDSLEDKHWMAHLIFYLKYKPLCVTKHAYKAMPIPYPAATLLIANALFSFLSNTPRLTFFFFFSYLTIPKLKSFSHNPANMKGRGFLLLSLLFCATFHFSLSLKDGKLPISMSIMNVASIWSC